MIDEPSHPLNESSPADLWREHRGEGYETRTRGDDGVSPRLLRPTASIAMVGARTPMDATRADHRPDLEPLDHFARVALVANALTGALDASEVVDIVVRQGMAGLDAFGGLLAFVDATGALVPAVAVGYSGDALAPFTKMTLEEQLPLTVAAREREAVWLSSREEARVRFPAFEARSVTSSQAWVAIPLVSAGTVIAVLGVSLLAPREFSECDKLFINALADVSGLALGRARTPVVSSVAPLDRSRKLVFAATLSLARIVTDHRIEPDVADRLIEVIEELDGAIRRTPDADDLLPQRRLCRFDDGEEFAYARGHDFFRASDHELWAHLSGDLLLSARSGTPFARRVGKAFHDVETDVPLFYLRSQ